MLLSKIGVSSLKPNNLASFKFVNSYIQKAGYQILRNKRKIIPVYKPLPHQVKYNTSVLLEDWKNTKYDTYDPTGWRRKLLMKSSSELLRSGDIVKVTFKNSSSNPPFFGYILSVTKRGLDSSLLLRNKITKLGVELRVKVFSPLVERIDVVSKPEKRNKRSRHYYIRGTRLDVPDLEAHMKSLRAKHR
ncbi:mitochondrial 54S ribosomal protein bL19m ASCRUDRAFT_75931 [Ascoidea rubescens DSM 1968]|uniref:Ribosomal protein L19 n=1 Tax=Ascoidea rubescens DSM 1968 TaxID=1344418 RepID=A0A1D2VI64_9ASCO|nr:hypothetical protein ASCRUDRAFT_75931 [Ascoidea rubescens DSM 1968]ODV61230.1 hypothetical protein ASCRUDRAFT_75931 [Ascoidea rubescens DSM 1968]